MAALNYELGTMTSCSSFSATLYHMAQESRLLRRYLNWGQLYIFNGTKGIFPEI